MFILQPGNAIISSQIPLLIGPQELLLVDPIQKLGLSTLSCSHRLQLLQFLADLADSFALVIGVGQSAGEDVHVQGRSICTSIGDLPRERRNQALSEFLRDCTRPPRPFAGTHRQRHVQPRHHRRQSLQVRPEPVQERARRLSRDLSCSCLRRGWGRHRRILEM
jgi:hypothetical protein